MEINTQQLNSLFHTHEQQQIPRVPGAAAPGFEALLKQQLLENESAAPLGGAEANRAAAIGGLFLDNNASDRELDPDSAVLQAAFEEASGTLDLWDSYSRTLGRSSSDSALRDAYTLLQGIDSRLSQLRSNPAIGKSAELDGILNELEVLAATEKFKFNRGDYLG